MKQILLLSLLISLPFLTRAQDISDQQTPMITKITATWCSNCGSWGWSFFKNAIEDNENNAILVAAHPSGMLQSFEGQDFTSNFGANGQPKFYLNNQDFGLSSSNGAAKRTELQQAVTDMNASTASVGAGLEVTRDGNDITAKTKVKFLESAEGTYYLTVYAIEDHVIETQQSVGPSADHRFVLRTSLNGSTFGESIAEGSTAQDTEVEKTYTATLNATWNPENMHYAAVIWKEVDGDFTYVNGHQVQETVVSSTNNLKNNKVSASWIASGDAHDLILISDKAYRNATLELLGMNGQLLQRQGLAEVSAGRQSIPLATAGLAEGTYAVRVSHPDFQASLLLVK